MRISRIAASLAALCINGCIADARELENVGASQESSDQFAASVPRTGKTSATSAASPITLPSDDGVLPSDDGVLPSDDGILPSADGVLPSDDGVLSSDDDVVTEDRLPECGPFTALVRDFHESHPDFETFTGTEVFPGIVETQLGSDDKPVYAPNGATSQTSGLESFEQWYRDIPGVNLGFEVNIAVEEAGAGFFVYDNPEFFPIDGRGFGNEGLSHNYHFTTEIHTSFTYRGGEIFTFIGDDDLWIFVNGRLAVDLGGLHEPRSGTIAFDAAAQALDIHPGETYSMDIFHAERHTVESNFRIETSIDCFIPVLPE